MTITFLYKEVDEYLIEMILMSLATELLVICNLLYKISITSYHFQLLPK
jgi:hypothetical protein